MLHMKSKGHRPYGSGEDLKVFFLYHYMGVAGHLLFPQYPKKTPYEILSIIGPVVSEMFEHVYRQI